MPKGIYIRTKSSHRRGIKASKETLRRQSIAQIKVNKRKSKEMCVICLINHRASINGRALYCMECRKEMRKKSHNKATIKCHNKRMKTDLKYRLRKYFSYKINKQLKRRFIHKTRQITINYLPYTIDELIQHLQNKFTLGMSWENYGWWHIDHIIPESSFNYRELGDKEFRKCWSLKNLQPLWAKENRIKGAKILEEVCK